MWCPSCGDEFREGVTRCPDCGVELVSDESFPCASEPVRPGPPEGYALLQGNWEGRPTEFIEWLDDEGIPVIPLASRRPDAFDLYVPRSHLSRAEQLLEEYYSDEYEEVEVEFDEDDLSARSRELLMDGDLDSFEMLTDGDEADMLELADRLEEAGIPVLVVDVETEEGVCEIHVPDRCREGAARLVESS